MELSRVAKRRRVDRFIKLLTSETGGEMPYGLTNAIAEISGCSREFVRQRANELNAITPRSVAREVFCKECGKSMGVISNKRKYCSKECRIAYFFKKYWTTKICQRAECGKEFKVQKSKEINRPRKYCSYVCAFWEKENMGKGRPLVYSKEWLEAKFKGQGFTVDQFSKEANILHNSSYTAISNLKERGLVTRISLEGREAVYKAND